MPELPGVDLDALSAWLDIERPGLRTGELSGEVIAGGKSNLTYRITDGTTAWALRRPPYLLETSCPGVFAAGDVRSGSAKRVAAAVGEGAMAVQLVHEYLRLM